MIILNAFVCSTHLSGLYGPQLLEAAQQKRVERILWLGNPQVILGNNAGKLYFRIAEESNAHMALLFSSYLLEAPGAEVPEQAALL